MGASEPDDMPDPLWESLERIYGELGVGRRSVGQTAWAKTPTDGVAIPRMVFVGPSSLFIRGIATLSVGHLHRGDG